MTKICCVCGDHANGKQRHNRDTGYGICARCAQEEIEKISYDEMYQNYGEYGIHYETEKEMQTVVNTHLSVSIPGLLNQLNNIRPGKRRDEMAQAFGAMNYADCCRMLYDMESKGKKCFTSDTCDNITEDGSCGGHKKWKVKQ